MAEKKKKILIIDDEDDIRLFLGTRLQRAGHETSEAPDGLEGLRRFYSGRPDLVVLDLAMPEMDGWQVLERIRESIQRTGNDAVGGCSREGQDQGAHRRSR